MNTYTVRFGGYRSSLSFVGLTAMMGYETSVTAADEQAAIEAAKAKAAAAGFTREATGRATVERLHEYAITVRGRLDKRTRETFIVRAPDEPSALKRLGYVPAATKFANVFSGKGRAENVVKVEVLA